MSAVSRGDTNPGRSRYSGSIALLHRSRLEEPVSDAVERRLTFIVGASGFGKSTLLAAGTGPLDPAWYTVTKDDRRLVAATRGIIDALRLRVPDLPSDLLLAAAGTRGPDADRRDGDRADAYASLIAAALDDLLRRDLLLVLDDLHKLGSTGASLRLVEGLIRQAPQRLHVVVASRYPLPFRTERLRASGDVLMLTGPSLAFSVEETADLLDMVVDSDARVLAPGVHALTKGWPAATRMVGETLRGVNGNDRVASLERLCTAEAPLFASLTAGILASEREETRRLLTTLAHLDHFSPRLCEALGFADAEAMLAELLIEGVYLAGPSSSAGELTLNPLIRTYLLDTSALPAAERDKLHRAAAAWYAERSEWAMCLEHLHVVGDHRDVARLITLHGERLLTAGRGRELVAAAASLPADARNATIDRIEGRAREVLGDWDGALSCLRRLVPTTGDIAAGIAWRIGLIHHLRGELDEAIATYGRGRTGDTEAPEDVALLFAWQAAAHWLRGECETAGKLALSALDMARLAEDDQALAAAHTVLAMVAAFDGDRAANEMHYLRALEHAEQAQDVLQTIRIHVNRASHYIEEGSFEDALSELDVALRLADLAGFASFRALALSNAGEAKFLLGRVEEAVADLEAAKTVYERLGSQLVAYPLCHLGDVHRARGDMALARAAYEEAIDRSRRSGDLQGLVPSLSGLARVLATTEPDRAQALAAEAATAGPVLGLAGALLARGWVAIEMGDTEGGRAAASEAASVARRRRDRAALAEALELEARCQDDTDEAMDRLGEARSIWDRLGSPLGVARVDLARARTTPGPAGLDLARSCESRLRQLGARGTAVSAARLVEELERRSVPPIAVQTLGGFRVMLSGVPIASGAWQSRKARTLLKVLIARHGGPVHREVLMEILWPGEVPSKSANRLSVVLSTLRSVLDPRKAHAGDHVVAADGTSVWLVSEGLTVDLEEFMAAAGRGLEAHRRGKTAEASMHLDRADALYRGGFLEGDAYQEWAIGTREESRATYVAVLLNLSQDALACGEPDVAGRFFLRILEMDPYDERAHLGLVSAMIASGRHGEARRLYGMYVSRMDELDVEAAPYPHANRRR